MTSSAAYSAFISYASENREKADEICASLERRGLVCWMAPRDIRAGREYADEIIHGLERSAAVVLVLSEAANTSVFVLREIERAVSKDINVVPVRIEEVTPSPGLELFISGTHWMDVWRGDWDDHMDRLVRDLSDSPVGPATVEASAGHRSIAPQRSFRMVYVAAGLALLVALGGIAIWSFPREAPLQTSDGPAPVQPSGGQDGRPASSDYPGSDDHDHRGTGEDPGKCNPVGRYATSSLGRHAAACRPQCAGSSTVGSKGRPASSGRRGVESIERPERRLRQAGAPRRRD